MKECAVWLRVSGDAQENDNQVPAVERFCRAHSLHEVRRFVVEDTAWRNGGGPEYRAALRSCMECAWRGEFSVVVVWALDRIVRTGAEDALRVIRQFRERNCVLISVQESWLNGQPEVVDILVAFAGWIAQQESARRSERTKAGMARARAAGKQIGRPVGARDRKPRKRRAA